MFWSYVYNLPTGAVASYWQLMSLYVSVGNGQAIAKVRGFVNEAAFLDGKTPLVEQELSFPVLQLDTDGQLFQGVMMLAVGAQAEQFPNQP